MKAIFSTPVSGQNAVEALTKQHNWIFGAYMVLLVFGLILTYLVWISGNRVQDAIRTEADARIKEVEAHSRVEIARVENEAKERIADLNLKSEQAQAAAASARRDAIAATTKAESFRLDIAKANERAAMASETAERERLARLQLEAQLAPRVLSPLQQRAIGDALRPLGKFSAQIFWFSDTTEVTRLSDAIVSALASAGWEVAGAHAQGGVTVQGIVIAVRGDAGRGAQDAAVRIVSELARNGVSSIFSPRPADQIPGPGMSFGSTIPNPQIRIMIGNK